MKEIWKDIKDYEGYYQVSNLGNVRSIGRMIDRRNSQNYFLSSKLLKQFDNGCGYKTVCISKSSKPKKMYVHRLVAEAFLINPDNLPEVNHKDENKANNSVDNLEWCTPKYNKNYGNRAKKFGISRGKPVLCVEMGMVYYNANEAHRMTGICASSICSCCTGYRNTELAGGYHWKYYEKETRESIL